MSERPPDSSTGELLIPIRVGALVLATLGSMAFVALSICYCIFGNAWGRLIGVVGIMVMGLFAWLGSRRFLERRRLIVNDSALLAVEGQSRVVGRIPFDNVGAVELYTMRYLWVFKMGTCVGFRVVDRDRSDTFWDGGRVVRNLNRSMFAFDYFVEPSYVLPPERLLVEIQGRMRRGFNPGGQGSPHQS